MTFAGHVARARALLQQAGIDAATAALDAELLARHVQGWDRATWISRALEEADDSFQGRYTTLIARRSGREPIAYIRGVQEFWGREFVVSPAVLIPRPETEVIIEAAHAYLERHPSATVIDVGTGSGCIAITLALEHPAAQVLATDISDDALAVARINAVRLAAADRVRFLHATNLENLSGLDLIVSNPPYVMTREWAALPPEVAGHEPAVALSGGDDGLRVVREILQQAARALTAGGQLIVEIGYGQLEAVASEVSTTGTLRIVTVHSDLQRIPRAVVIQRAAEQ